MRILHIIDSGGLYGAEAVLLNLMHAQAALGHTPVLASIGTHHDPDKAIERQAQRLSLPFERFRMRAGPNLAGARRLLDYAHQSGVDLLHSHGYKGNILLGLLANRWRKLPMISTVHGYTWSGGLDRMFLYEKLDAMSLQRVDRVVLVDPAMLHHRLLSGRRQYEVIENGIALDASPAPLPRAVEAFIEGHTTIATVGRISREKGADLLLEAFARSRAQRSDLRLVFMGEGEMQPALQQRCVQLGIDEEVLFAGYVDRAGSTLGRFDLFVMPSLTEGLPMVLLEAMAAGATIVTTRVGGMPGVLEQGKAGLLVDAGDVKALSAGIAATLDDPVAAKQRTERALARVHAHYSSAVMAASYLDLYREVVDQSGAAS